MSTLLTQHALERIIERTLLDHDQASRLSDDLIMFRSDSLETVAHDAAHRIILETIRAEHNECENQ